MVNLMELTDPAVSAQVKSHQSFHVHQGQSPSIKPYSYIPVLTSTLPRHIFKFIYRPPSSSTSTYNQPLLTHPYIESLTLALRDKPANLSSSLSPPILPSAVGRQPLTNTIPWYQRG